MDKLGVYKEKNFHMGDTNSCVFEYNAIIFICREKDYRQIIQITTEKSSIRMRFLMAPQV